MESDIKEGVAYLRSLLNVVDRSKIVPDTKYYGIVKHRLGWCAKIPASGNVFLTFSFDSELEAAAAYDYLVLKIRGAGLLNGVDWEHVLNEVSIDKLVSISELYSGCCAN